MKTLIAVALVVGFAALGSAQTAAPSRSSLMISADQVSGPNMQGNVEAKAVVTGVVQFTADAVELSNDGRDVTLRGNVVLRLPDKPKILARDAAGRVTLTR